MDGPFVTASGAKQSRKIGFTRRRKGAKGFVSFLRAFAPLREIIWLPGFAAVTIGG